MQSRAHGPGPHQIFIHGERLKAQRQQVRRANIDTARTLNARQNLRRETLVFRQGYYARCCLAHGRLQVKLGTAHHGPARNYFSGPFRKAPCFFQQVV